jgi:molybdenum cofactor biosynthesis protein B
LSHHEHRKSGEHLKAALALLTVSDTRTEETDHSAAAARRLLEASGHLIAEYAILPDEPDQVGDQLRQWLRRDDCDGAIVMGGTGISARDRTYEAVISLLEKRLDGFGELFRALSYEQIGSAAMMSRAVAGTVGGHLLFALPGSRAAVELALERLILPELGHLLAELRKH